MQYLGEGSLLYKYKDVNLQPYPQVVDNQEKLFFSSS